MFFRYICTEINLVEINNKQTITGQFMKGRFFIMKNSDYEELLYTIADFFWNNGNQVIIQDNFIETAYYRCFLFQKPWIVTVNANDFSETANKIKANGQPDNFIIINFASNGVYTNLIPFPHKIYQYKKLNKSQLNNFFRWCIKFSLFNTSK